MKTLERLAEGAAGALAKGVKKGLMKSAIRGEKKGVAVRGGARIVAGADGQLEASFNKDTGFHGDLDLVLSGPVAQIPGVNADVGANVGGSMGTKRGENFGGKEKLQIEIWVEIANLTAIAEDEDNFGDESTHGDDSLFSDVGGE